MTIVPVQTLEPDDLSHLGENLTEAIRQDHEDLEAGNKELDCLEEQTVDPEIESED
jgi:hypothetical protein